MKTLILVKILRRGYKLNFNMECKHRDSILLPRADLETDLERWLLPKTENLLLMPVLHTFIERHVEIP